MKGMIGRKIGMIQVFHENGNVIPVTVIQAGPCHVVQRKTRDVDGYEAVQLGFREVKPSKVNKPRAGHFRRHATAPCRILKEIRVDDASHFTPGQVITVDAFQAGEKVKVKGTSKGRGFTGVVKRHGFSGAHRTHGTHEYFRHGGSIGASAYPARVFKGTKMPGQHGNRSVTVRNLMIYEVRPHDHLLLIKGAVPGPNGGILFLQGEGEFAAMPEVSEEKTEQADTTTETDE
jgi:large subunit ribosomal protein L3